MLSVSWTTWRHCTVQVKESNIAVNLCLPRLNISVSIHKAWNWIWVLTIWISFIFIKFRRQDKQNNNQSKTNSLHVIFIHVLPIKNYYKQLKSGLCTCWECSCKSGEIWGQIAATWFSLTSSWSMRVCDGQHCSSTLPWSGLYNSASQLAQASQQNQLTMS